jgi:hypothetical protein
MLLFTYGNSAKKNVIPYENVKDDPSFVPGKIPTAKYFRKATTCGDKCTTTEVVKVVDCNACKVKRSANTKMSNTYYASSSSYLRARSKQYEQGLAKRNYNSETHSITKDGCDPRYNCGVMKNSNSAFRTNGAVSSGTKIMRTRYQNVVDSYNTNTLRPRYHGDTTTNVQFKSQKPVCHRRNGTKTTC